AVRDLCGGDLLRRVLAGIADAPGGTAEPDEHVARLEKDRVGPVRLGDVSLVLEADVPLGVEGGAERSRLVERDVALACGGVLDEDVVPGGNDVRLGGLRADMDRRRERARRLLPTVRVTNLAHGRDVPVGRPSVEVAAHRRSAAVEVEDVRVTRIPERGSRR